ncbi:uncharacterized protein [Asterias amurensis]|uniref:uncharacterized protein n=1 Tax=Asterias amurensis TaxID=7602 RepID=UPI003AB65204
MTVKGSVVVEEKIRQNDYLGFACLSFFFCPLFGILSIWKSRKCKARLRKGDDIKAELSALNALKWGMTAVALGASIYFMAIVFGIYYLVAFYFGDAEYPFIDFQ